MKTNELPMMLIRLLIVLAGLIIVAVTPAHVLWLDIGSPSDEQYIRGAYPAERNPVESYRWTAGPSEIRVPVALPGEYDLEFTLADLGDQPRSATLDCDDDELRIDLGEQPGHFTDTLTCETDGQEIAATIDTELASLPDDSRLLGVSVVDVRVTPADPITAGLYQALELLTMAAVLAGVWFTGRAVASRRGEPLVLAFVCLWLLAALRRPDLVVSLVPSVEAVAVLAGGVAAWKLRRGDRLVGGAIALLLALLLILVEPTPLALKTVGLWLDVDVAAANVLPWVTVAAVALGAALGGARAYLLPAFGTGVALIALFSHVIEYRAGERLNVTIAVPDWTASGTAFSALLILLIGGIAVLGAVVATRSDLPVQWSMLLLAGATLAMLLGWRVQTMDFNGDEPHYYVMARSIGQDADLELLDDYLDPAYQQATISPHGNVAVRRDFSANRYSALAPRADGAWYLIPPDYAGWESEHDAGPVQTSGQPLLQHHDGSQARLPAIQPGRDLVLLNPAGCLADRLWIAAVDASDVDINLTILGGDGGVRLGDSLTTGASGEIVERAIDAGCEETSPLAIHLTATGGDIVAMGYDRSRGYPFASAIEGGARLYAGMPRDRYASQNALTRVLLHNRGDEPSSARVELLGPSERAALVEEVPLQPGETVERTFRIPGASALRVSGEDGGSAIAGAVVAHVAGADYRVAAAVETREWSVPVNAARDLDAGVWLTLVNQTADWRSVSLSSATGERSVEVCGGCAVTELLTAEDGPQVDVSAPAGVSLAGVEYEERTGELHFDPGLPILAAPLAYFGSPWFTLLVPAIAGALLAAGVVALLRAVGLGRGWLVVGGAATLLAPMSPFAIRLYTEIVATALIVWALVFWQRGRANRWWNAATVGVSILLPVLHGRLIPIAVVMLALVAVNLVDTMPLKQLRRRHLIGVGVALGILLLVAAAAAELLVSPFSRDVADYFQLRWVPTNVTGMLLDRGSGLIPVAPWVALAVFVPRPLSPLQRAGLILILVSVSIVALRAGSWMTWGPPGRYLLPAVPLLLLFAMPAARELWRHWVGRLGVGVAAAWSIVATMLLHWLPLAGYVAFPRYLIDDTLESLLGGSPARIFPSVQPDFGGLGYQIIGAILIGALAVTAVIQIWMLIPLLRKRLAWRGR